LRRGNQLQQFLGIIEPFSEFVLVSAEGSCGELRGYAGVFQARVGCDKADLIQPYALGAGERSFQLDGEFGGLCFARWKRPGETADFLLRDRGKKLNAGKSCGGKQLSELFFGGSAFERNAIKKQL
jgi:hypothetical protein